MELHLHEREHYGRSVEKVNCSSHIFFAYVRNRTDIVAPAVQSDSVGVWESENRGLGEATMFGYGLIGTLVVILLVVWIVRAL
jgi:hypothetical protein